MSQKPPTTPEQLDEEIRGYLVAGVAGILAAGQRLIDLKASLPHGQWGAIVPEKSADKVERLMAIARHEVIQNPQNLRNLPLSPTTLYELSRLEPVQFNEAMVAGHIHADMRGHEASALYQKYRRTTATRKAKPGPLDAPASPADVYARYVVGDAAKVIAAMPDACVNSIVCSPPYLAKRSYLPDDHPAKGAELGQEATPGEYLADLLAVTDEAWRVLADDGTIWFVLGDTAAYSGGSGGDYLPGGLREGQARYEGTARRASRWPRSKKDWPLAKSVCWMPELFGASLAYGHNLLTGAPCHQWVTRPPVTWCKPNPAVGEIIDKFREATELVVWAAKTSKPGGYYFGLDELRTPASNYERRTPPSRTPPGQPPRATRRTANPKGTPPFDWWTIPSAPYPDAHYATYPPALVERLLIASCPPGGVVLDPFCGSGTTLAVAAELGRSSVGVDIDERNVDLARRRVGAGLEVVDAEEAVA